MFIGMHKKIEGILSQSSLQARQGPRCQGFESQPKSDTSIPMWKRTLNKKDINK